MFEIFCKKKKEKQYHDALSSLAVRPASVNANLLADSFILMISESMEVFYSGDCKRIRMELYEEKFYHDFLYIIEETGRELESLNITSRTVADIEIGDLKMEAFDNSGLYMVETLSYTFRYLITGDYYSDQAISYSDTGAGFVTFTNDVRLGWIIQNLSWEIEVK